MQIPEEYKDVIERSASTGIQSAIGVKLVGDDSASLVTLKRDPKTGRFMKREK